MPDPFLLDADHRYFMYLSSIFGDTHRIIPLLRGSPNHCDRTTIDAVPKMPAWADTIRQGATSWVPEVHRLDDRYVMYFSPTLRASPTHHCIAVATSASPTGPFHAEDKPLVCQLAIGGDIDAQLFIDPTGPRGQAHPDYLIWKSDNNSDDGWAGPPQIWAQSLSNDGMHLTGRRIEIYAPDQPWQDNLVEAPQMALSPSHRVWLFYSAGQGFDQAQYGMGVVRCAGPLGPCAGGDTVPLISSNWQGSGPGEETYFASKDGTDWLLYSPWYSGTFDFERPVEAARIGWSSAGPFIAAANRFPGP